MSEARDPPSDREAILSRIEVIDCKMIEIQRAAAIKGADLRRQWDKLVAERSHLEMRLRDE